MMRYHYHDYVTLHGRKDCADVLKVPNQLTLEFTSRKSLSRVGIISPSEPLKELKEAQSRRQIHPLA